MQQTAGLKATIPPPPPSRAPGPLKGDQEKLRPSAPSFHQGPPSADEHLPGAALLSTASPAKAPHRTSAAAATTRGRANPRSRCRLLTHQFAKPPRYSVALPPAKPGRAGPGGGGREEREKLGARPAAVAPSVPRFSSRQARLRGLQPGSALPADWAEGSRGWFPNNAKPLQIHQPRSELLGARAAVH